MSGVHESQPLPTEPSEKAPLREEGEGGEEKESC